MGEWWKTSWAHCEEHKKEFGFDLVGDVAAEGFRQGNGMTVTGWCWRMPVLPLGTCSETIEAWT